MMYHHTQFELPNAFHKNYMNVQSCIMSAFVSINIVLSNDILLTYNACILMSEWNKKIK